MSQKQICSITGKLFIISDAEIALRETLGVALPIVHPNERMRELLSWRNDSTLYAHACDNCKKSILSFFNPTNTFPQYCRVCYFSDSWQAPQKEIDFSRPFFEQVHELYNATPSWALAVTEPMENSDYCNAVTAMKNCYMCFNAGFCENCIYVKTGMHNKECVDTLVFGNSEIAYECMGGGHGYKLFWSQQVIKCTESYFLYDCQDCMNCFMSCGLRHKQYVFRNVQMNKEEYEREIGSIDFGSFSTIKALEQEFEAMKKSYPKPRMIGVQNEAVSGNHIYACKDVYESYLMEQAENCVNCYDCVNLVKDCLDVCTFGYGLEQGYCSMGLGHNDYNVRYSVATIENSINCEYCLECRNCSDCFGCTGISKKQYCILNKQYTKEEYEIQKKGLIDHMHETGEYGSFFPKSMCPFGYNETVAQLTLPLSQEQARMLGFKWYEKPIPAYSQQDVYTPLDNIKDIAWTDVQGKVIVCEESGRPFKIIKQEFDFYKKYSIPLPRLHPEVRVKNRYPTDELYNLHTTQCSACGVEVETSMPDTDSVLCEACYQKQIY
ncbi:MAG: hypothetical protein Q8P56_06160 [Candidatus Uhrbacteria bacterium]|nr:hypothetical protein [Candidatus Uhrbacteria bacterium]